MCKDNWTFIFHQLRFSFQFEVNMTQLWKIFWYFGQKADERDEEKCVLLNR